MKAKKLKARRAGGFSLKVSFFTDVRAGKGISKQFRIPFAPAKGLALVLGTFEGFWVERDLDELVYDPKGRAFVNVCLTPLGPEDEEMYREIGFKDDPGFYADGPGRHLRLVKGGRVKP